MGLTTEQVAKLYAGRREKGGYERMLNELMQSDENGISAKDVYPALKNKSAATLYQGFRTAASNLAISDQIDVINSDGQVFVIVKGRVELQPDNGNKSSK